MASFIAERAEHAPADLDALRDAMDDLRTASETDAATADRAHAAVLDAVEDRVKAMTNRVAEYDAALAALQSVATDAHRTAAPPRVRPDALPAYG